MENTKAMETEKTEGVMDAEYKRLVSIWNQVLDHLNRDGDATHMRGFIKKGLLNAVNCLVGYHIVLVADYWYNKHVLLEEDLGEIILAVKAANGGRLSAGSCTLEELEWVKRVEEMKLAYL